MSNSIKLISEPKSFITGGNREIAKKPYLHILVSFISDPNMRPAYHRRSLLEQYHEILEILNKRDSLKPTRLMYAVNMSWLPLKQCLNSLESIGLIQWVNPTLSKKGEVALTIKGKNAYKSITEYVVLLSQARDKMPN